MQTQSHQPGLDAIKAHFQDRAVAAQAILDQHAHDESFHPWAPPDLVVFARSTEDVAAAVRICTQHKLPIVAFGAGTSLEGNVNAVRGGVCIDLSQMDRVLQVNPEDFDCTVQAGVRRKQLNTELRTTGLFFPIDPGPDATIGGMAATRASGTNAVRYGTMRENVIALTVVTAGGHVVRTSRRARKSAAGYDLTRLFVGSEGTLGIITEVTLRLSGIPEETIVGRCAFPSEAAAVDTAIQTLQSGVTPARVEFLDDRLIAAVNRYSGLDLPETSTLFFELHGSAAHVAEQCELLEAIASENDCLSFEMAQGPDERTRLWQARHDAYYATVNQRRDARGLATDVCVPISRIAECIVETKKDLEDCPVPACIMGHVGDGNFHVVFSLNADDPAELKATEEIGRRLVSRALAMDGTCTGEHGVGLGKKKYLPDEFGEEAMQVMRLLKTSLDPDNIFNPGKIVDPA
ncbi:FAD-binding oxidoreductase [Sinisalibacter aestuarii]|uniref:FAD-binding oxidoreductase n=1 Tax=Sinisalibacter aestuarii TaxID=2949426 RepID=UPI002492E91F|nr:FAD-linked oxidase C-terminal domain-containing protein [Sinisalibacter aestuarii]